MLSENNITNGCATLSAEFPDKSSRAFAIDVSDFVG
jgi:hypothetical protein